MRTVLSLEEIQQCELSILKKCVEFFNNNDIKYFLAYGTMLGAVRHSGFIPWDDDIDIFVPRDDYEKLKTLLHSGKMTADYLLYGIPGDNNYPYPFIKIKDSRYIVKDSQLNDCFSLNLWIDIFPLDHLPDDSTQAKNLIIKTAKFMGLLGTEIAVEENSSSLKYKAKKCVAEVLGGYRGIARYIDRRAQRINTRYNNSKVMGNIVWPQYKKDFFKLNMIYPLTKHLFSDSQFLIPENYDEHLSYLYGDYRQLPPEDKRQRHHILAYRES